MYNKTKIFNLALQALYLQKKIADADTDTSRETTTLETNWESAFFIGLQEMDLDSTSTTKALELISEKPNTFWDYCYKYPTDCAFMRRIVSELVTDDTETVIDRKVQILDGEKVILTNQPQAYIEYIPNTITAENLTPEAAVFISLKLARMSVPLIVGKNSREIVQLIEQRYEQALVTAQEKDRLETSIYQPEWTRSEFAKERLS